MKFGEYELEYKNKIGSGGCGTVYIGKHIKTGRVVAVKVIDEFPSDNHVRREVDFLKKLKHENIVEVFYAEVMVRTVYLVMEYFPDGDLNQMIRRQTISESEIKNFLRQMVAGLSYMNSKNIMHKDINLSNILVKDSNNKRIYKITDFGIARLIESNTKMTGFTTRYFMAPEILAGEPASFNADVYSLGVTIDEMLRDNINSASKTLKDLYVNMTKKNPKNRYTITDVGNHGFLKDDITGQDNLNQTTKDNCWGCFSL